MSIKPSLDKNISLDDFLSYYWHTDDLKKFCKEIGIDSTGGKNHINLRIVKYLENGIIEEPIKKALIKKTEVIGVVNSNTIIPENILLTDNIRSYFESQIKGKFRFSKELIAFFRTNYGKTMGEAIEFYLLSKKNKRKNNTGETNIPNQCQYNQFIRDYLKDNKSHSFQEAVNEWNKIRDTKSDFKYKKK